MEIDHGGFELGMAHVSLDDPQIDSGFEKMGGVGMAESMNGDRLFLDSSSNLGPTEGALDTALGHGKLGLFCSMAITSKCGEQEARVAVDHPIATEQIEGG